MNKFYVLVGSNIKPQINIEKGIELIHKSKIIEIESMSKEYHSDPVGMEGNRFINMVLRCKTKLSFRETLAQLKKIEMHCGRIRDPNNKFTSRTLDLDIIDWNGEEAIIEGYQMPDPDIKKHDYIKIPYSEIRD
tara:strand:+ start:1003 stop:1404 length:402 start_codon:yes stop_codon:yes gene_type:complete